MHRLLTPRCLAVLRMMRDAEDQDRLDDAEIVQDGGECWVGDTRISPRTVIRLVQLVLVRHENMGGCDHYTLNEEGRLSADDPDRTPKILALLRSYPSRQPPPALVQEGVSRDLHYPWRVLVCCALLNRTTGAQVRAVVGELFARCPNPASLLCASLDDLLEPLGLYNRRATLLRRLTWDYLAGSPPADCYGAGQYARDALAIFCDGRTDLEPGDHWLAGYLQNGGGKIKWDRAGHRAWRRAQGFH